MKTILHTSNSRGHFNHGWLNTWHSFSFGQYNNPERIHFGALRVLNDDIVKGGMGFSLHPHDNMEIITIPLEGALQHKDNTGGQGIIKKYDVQIMSAGTGIMHSESNANHQEEVNLLQIWVFPKERNIQPRYDQKTFLPEDRINKFQVVVAPNEVGALNINQDAWFLLGNLKDSFSTTYALHQPTNGVYAFIISGEATIGGTKLSSRDAAGFFETNEIQITADADSEILLIEVPMEF